MKILRNVNQTTLKYHFSPSNVAKPPKYDKLIMGEKKPLYIAGEGIRLYSLSRKQFVNTYYNFKCVCLLTQQIHFQAFILVLHSHLYK